MDLHKTIRDLLEERRRLDAIIARLERVQATDVAKALHPQGKRRGRKSMSEDERRVVSERMRKYWADRRKGEAKSAAGSGG